MWLLLLLLLLLLLWLPTDAIDDRGWDCGDGAIDDADVDADADADADVGADGLLFMREANSDRSLPEDGAGAYTYSAEVVVVRRIGVELLAFEFLCRWVVCWPENRGIVVLLCIQQSVFFVLYNVIKNIRRLLLTLVSTVWVRRSRIV